MKSISSLLSIAAIVALSAGAAPITSQAAPSCCASQMPVATQQIGNFSKSEYTGYVGRMYAEFELTWSANGEVAGTYTYPGKRRTIYLLKGENVREGVLRLEEYTGNELTATIHLRKSIDGTQVVWSGVMKNTDGREFPVEIRRTGTR